MADDPIEQAKRGKKQQGRASAPLPPPAPAPTPAVEVAPPDAPLPLPETPAVARVEDAAAGGSVEMMDGKVGPYQVARPPLPPGTRFIDDLGREWPPTLETVRAAGYTADGVAEKIVAEENERLARLLRGEEALPPSYKTVDGTPMRMARARQYRVLERTRISLGGHISFLVKGDVIDHQHYGDADIKKLVDQGVQLEPVEPTDE